MLREMSVLKDMEYVRTGGSKEELKCAKYLQSKLKEIGLESRIEEFPVQASKISKCSLEVTKPYKKSIPCLGYFCSGSTKGLKKELYYLRDNQPGSIAKVKGKIVLIDKYLRYWTYKDILENGAVGFITCNGSLYEENSDIDQRELRDQLKKLGTIPGVQINSKDAYEMVTKGASEVKIVLEQEEYKNKSRNVICDIKGESKDTIVFTAHYDSTSLSKGSYDNATGSVGILKIAEYFAKNKPLHNLTFIWCGSEERGLLGSHAYVNKHKKELDNISLCINLDMIGSTMGNFVACVTGEDKLVHYVDYLSKEVDFPLEAYQDVYSSDSTPFADKGIPAISFARLTNMTPIHCRHDDMSILKEEVMVEDVKFIIEFSKHMANAKIIPVKKVMPDNMKEKLDIYLCRKKKEEGK